MIVLLNLIKLKYDSIESKYILWLEISYRAHERILQEKSN